MREAFKYFDGVFLINLDKRKDRLDRCNTFFNEHNIIDLIERFSGIIPNEDDIPHDKNNKKMEIGVYGCILSHLNLVINAKKKGLKSILVLEDDVNFINIEYINKSINQLKNREWDLFYLGSNTHVPLEKVDDNLLILKKGYATHAVAYHERFYDYFIESFSNDMIDIIDVWLSDYAQENFKAYCTYPITAIQHNDYSDINNSYIDYSWMEEKFKKNTQHI